MLLKVEGNDPQRELQFELDYLATLTTEQRFRMMVDRSNLFIQLMIRNGHRKPVEIVKRPCR